MYAHCIDVGETPRVAFGTRGCNLQACAASRAKELSAEMTIFEKSPRFAGTLLFADLTREPRAFAEPLAEANIECETFGGRKKLSE